MSLPPERKKKKYIQNQLNGRVRWQHCAVVCLLGPHERDLADYSHSACRRPHGLDSQRIVFAFPVYWILSARRQLVPAKSGRPSEWSFRNRRSTTSANRVSNQYEQMSSLVVADVNFVEQVWLGAASNTRRQTAAAVMAGNAKHAHTNGFANGHAGETFLFTSESVGEGHPGEEIQPPITSRVLYFDKGFRNEFPRFYSDAPRTPQRFYHISSVLNKNFILNRIFIFFFFLYIF